MSEGFNWENAEDVVIPRTDATAIYVNVSGDVVIRQQDAYGGDDVMVIIPKHHLATVIEALTVLK